MYDQHDFYEINTKKKNFVEEHIEAVKIANDLGIAVDAFTMFYPWEDEQDLYETTEMVEQIAQNPVNRVDEKGRSIKNYVSSTIMTPYQGTEFFDMLQLGTLPDVEMISEIDLGKLYFKGINAGSGWSYRKTRLPKEQYEEAQAYRNSLRPDYR